MAEAGGWDFKLYEDKEGRTPAWEFMQTLKDGERGGFTARIQMVKAKGFAVGGEVLENLGDDLYVIRVPNTPNNPRLFLCVIQPKTFVALHGYCKRSDQIPAAELRIALSRLLEVMNNKKRYQR